MLKMGRSVGQSAFAKVVPFVGPAFLVSVGYMDPGNWATAIEGGSRFGYELAWVVVLSTVIAILLQTLSARLGLVTGKHLAQVCRDEYPHGVCILLWILCEVSIVALDLTMVLGTAIGLNLLFGIPMLPGVLLMGLDALLILVVLPHLGVRKAEIATVAVVGIVLLCFVVDIFLSKPPMTAVVSGLWPRLSRDSLYTAVSLLGANVMPHNFYLHSALVKGQVKAGEKSVGALCYYNFLDIACALGAALLVNLAVLIVAAATFHSEGLVVLTLQDAHALMEQILSNSMAPLAFGLALLSAGQLSTLTGTIAGQVVLEGFLGYEMRAWLRRVLTRSAAIIPAALYIWRYGDEGTYRMLVLMQVVLALQLPFTIIPLIKVTSSKRYMGVHKNPKLVEVLAWASSGLVFFVNVWLVADMFIAKGDHTSLSGKSQVAHAGMAFKPMAASEKKEVLPEHLKVVGGVGLVTEREGFGVAVDGPGLFGFLRQDMMQAIGEMMLLLTALSGVAVGVLLLGWMMMVPIKGNERMHDSGHEFGKTKRREDWWVELDRRTEESADKEAPELPLELIEVGLREPQAGDLLESPRYVVDVDVDTDDKDRDSVGKTGHAADKEEEVGDKKVVSEFSGVSRPHPPGRRDSKGRDSRRVHQREREREKQGQGTEGIGGGNAGLRDREKDKGGDEDDGGGGGGGGGGHSGWIYDLIHESMYMYCINNGHLKGWGPGDQDPGISSCPRPYATKETAAWRPPNASHTPCTLGRSGRRQFASILDDFWAHIFDLHGQPAGPLGVWLLASGGGGGGGDDGDDGGGDDQRGIPHQNIGAAQPMIDRDKRGRVCEYKEPTTMLPAESASNGPLSIEGDRALGQPLPASSGGVSTDVPWHEYRDHPISAPMVSKDRYAIENIFQNQTRGNTWKFGQHRTSDGCGPNQGRDSADVIVSEFVPKVLVFDDCAPQVPVFQPFSLFGNSQGSPGMQIVPSPRDSSIAAGFMGPLVQCDSAGVADVRNPAQTAATGSLIGEGSQSRWNLGDPLLVVDSARTTQMQSDHMQPYGVLWGLERVPSTYHNWGQQGGFLWGDSRARESSDTESISRQESNPESLSYWLRSPQEVLFPSSSTPSPNVGGGAGVQPIAASEPSPLWHHSLSQLDGRSAATETAVGIPGYDEDMISSAPEDFNQHSTQSIADADAIMELANRTNNGGENRVDVPSFAATTDPLDSILDELDLCLHKLRQLDKMEWLFRLRFSPDEVVMGWLGFGWIGNGPSEDDNQVDSTVIVAEPIHSRAVLLEPDTIPVCPAEVALTPHGDDRIEGSSDAQGSLCLARTPQEGQRFKGARSRTRVRKRGCGEKHCVWNRDVIVSFGVWCVLRMLELCQLESRPELWGKYTYVLNRLQGILESAFLVPRRGPPTCLCIRNPLDSAPVQGGWDIRKPQPPPSPPPVRESQLVSSRLKDPPHHGQSPGGCVTHAPIRHDSSSESFEERRDTDMITCPLAVLAIIVSQTRSLPDVRLFAPENASLISSVLDLIKSIEIAVGSRKGRSGTAAGDVAFPKGKENLASVLKRYRRRIAGGGSTYSSTKAVSEVGLKGRRSLVMSSAVFFFILMSSTFVFIPSQKVPIL